jgi:predicted acylesterase/phospholipase RssA
MPIEVDPRDREDLRLAVVMTGGVSLAIWMGGVALEIERLRRVRESSAYRQLLEITQSDVRIDVIAGTSAGGLNGAFLAASTAYDRPLDALRKVWLRHASLYQLTRSPYGRDHPSLLDGDGYFLPRLQEAFTDLRGDRMVAIDHPLELSMTAALLRGQGETFYDRYRNEIPEVTHLGIFRFERDDFADPAIVSRLALAARTSAAHPGGFEASFIPMTDEEATSDHPSMRGVASWKLSRFAIDGGVLLNRPLKPALATILTQPADREVRRLVLFVTPDPGRRPGEIADKVEERPTLAATVMAVARLPAVQSVTEQLRDIQQHNEQVARQRRVRRDLARSGALFTTAAPLYRTYLSLRARRSAESVAGHLAPQLGSSEPAQPPDAISRLTDNLELAFIENYPAQPPSLGSATVDPWPWGVTAIERAIRTVLDLLRQAIGIAPPDPVQGDEETPRSELRDLRRVGHTVLMRARELVSWEIALWRSPGLGPPARGEELPWLRVALEQVPGSLGAQDSKNPPPWRGVDVARPTQDPRTELALLVGALMAATAPIVANVAYGILSTPGPTPRESADRTIASDHVAASALLDQLFGFADVQAVDRPRRPATPIQLMPWSQQPFGAQVGFLRRLPIESGVSASIAGSIAEMFPEISALTRSRDTELLGREIEYWLWRLLLLEIAQVPMLTGADSVDQEIELVSISSRVPNCFDSRNEPHHKLTGLQLAHFGAFYKMSWRANDWMWGRLDAAYHLSQVLLDPRRLLRLRYTANEAVDAIGAVANGGIDEVANYLADDSVEREAAARAELAFLDDPAADPPLGLPVCTRWVARRIQLEILLEELPWVARAVADDLQGGGAQHEAARLFLNEFLGFPGDRATIERLSKRLQSQILAGEQPLGESLAPGQAVDLFHSCKIGEERIPSEMGSDLFSVTATKGVATAIAAASGPRAGIGPVRGVIGSLRGITLAMHGLTRGAIEGSRTGTALITAAIILGAVILAFDVVNRFESLRVVNSIALVLLVGGLVAAAIRTLWWVPVVASVLGTLSGFLLVVIAAPSESVWGLVVVVLGALALAALLMGGVRVIRSRRWVTGSAVAIFLAVAVTGLGLYVASPIPLGHPGLEENCGIPVGNLSLRLPSPSPTPVSTPDGVGPRQGPEGLLCAGIVRDWQVRSLALILSLAGLLGIWSLYPRMRTIRLGGNE